MRIVTFTDAQSKFELVLNCQEIAAIQETENGSTILLKNNSRCHVDQKPGEILRSIKQSSWDLSRNWS